MIAPEGRKLLRIEARNAAVPIERKPEWIKTRAHMGPEYTALRSLVSREGLHTVCQEAACPNIFECWEDKEATFLIGGEACTRRCDFCNIDTGPDLKGVDLTQGRAACLDHEVFKKSVKLIAKGCLPLFEQGIVTP